MTYRFPIVNARPYVEIEVDNLFDNDKLLFFDTSMIAELDGPVDEHGIPTSFQRGPHFGEATGAGSYQKGRTVRASFGVRF